MIDFFSKPWLRKLIGDNCQYLDSNNSYPYLQTKFEKEFGYVEIDRGGFRAVYNVDEDWVVKFPLDQKGVECNVVEQTLYEMYKTTGHFAKCRIENWRGVPLLFMHRVSDYFQEVDKHGNQKNHYEDLPDWAHHQDGPQVGFTKNRRLVIYDYGNCIDLFDKWYYKQLKKRAAILTNAPG